jgi:hypothetical protein
MLKAIDTSLTSLLDAKLIPYTIQNFLLLLKTKIIGGIDASKLQGNTMATY